MIAYPFTIMVVHEFRDRLQAQHPAYRLAYEDFNRAVEYWAPRWVAWLYQWLPIHVSWNNSLEQRRRQEAAWFLWVIAARRWSLAYLPKSRSTYGRSRFSWHIGPYGNRNG